MIDRGGFQEITRGRVTGTAIPTIGIHRVVHGIRRMALGKIDRIVVGPDVASAAARRVGGMYRIRERVGPGKAARDRAVDAGAVCGIRVTGAAITRRWDMPFWRRDHQYGIMRMSIMATDAIIGDTRGGIEAW